MIEQQLQQDEVAQLVADYDPLVQRTARRYARHPQDLDDLVQAGRIGLIKAATSPSYDPARHFGPWARKFVTGAVQDAAYALNAPVISVPERQRGNAELRRINVTAGRVDAPPPWDPDGNLDLGQTLADPGIRPDEVAAQAQAGERIRARQRAVLETMSGRDQQIVLSHHRWTWLAIELGHVDIGTVTWRTVTEYRDRGKVHHQVITDGFGGPSRREVGAVGAMGVRLQYSFTWPLPRDVAGIARELGLSRQAVYNVINRFKAEV